MKYSRKNSFPKFGATHCRNIHNPLPSLQAVRHGGATPCQYKKSLKNARSKKLTKGDFSPISRKNAPKWIPLK